MTLLEDAERALDGVSVPQPKVKTNDLKKGTRIRLRNGFFGTLNDNKRGNTRETVVQGYYGDEIGSVYSHDIVAAQVDDQWVEIEYTKSQLECKQFNEALFGG